MSDNYWVEFWAKVIELCRHIYVLRRNQNWAFSRNYVNSRCHANRVLQQIFRKQSKHTSVGLLCSTFVIISRTQILTVYKNNNKAIRYIKNLRGRSVSITDSRVQLELDTLQAIRKNKRIILFHTVLKHESFFPGLLNTLDQMSANHDFNTRNSSTFNSIVCNTNTFLHSFLIRTARDLRIGENAVDC